MGGLRRWGPRREGREVEMGEICKKLNKNYYKIIKRLIEQEGYKGSKIKINQAFEFNFGI